MSLESSDKLREWFYQFWKFAKEETEKGNLMSKPLLRVQENWDYWWKVELSTGQQQQIEQFVASMSDVAQESFIQWIKDWTRQQFQRAGAGRLVLMQLAHMPLCQSWKCLEPYRLKNLKGVNAIILQGEGGGQPDNIKPLLVTLIPKEKKDDPCWVQLNLKVSDAPLENVRNAALSLLRRVGLVLLLGGWGLVGRKPQQWWRPILLGAWAALAFGILCFLLIAASPTDDILVPALWTLLVATVVVVLCAIFSSLREVLHARKWAGLLHQSQLCMLLGGVEDGRPLKVEGPSFGVALCLGILLALYEEDPGTAEKSWLWGQLFARLAGKLPQWSFTGELRGWGRLKRVERVPDKMTASLNHSDIRHMVTPVQKEARLHVVQQTKPAISLSTCCVRQAAGKSLELGPSAAKLQLHRCWHMAQVLLAMGGLANTCTIGVRTVLALLFAVIVAALPDIRWIFFPPPDPEFVFKDCWVAPITPHGLGDQLQLSILTEYPTHFEAILTSPYWANREQPFYGKPNAPHVGYVMIELVKLVGAKGDGLAGEIQLVRPRKLWFLRLPDVVVQWDPLERIIKRGMEERKKREGLFTSSSR